MRSSTREPKQNSDVRPQNETKANSEASKQLTAVKSARTSAARQVPTKTTSARLAGRFPRKILALLVMLIGGSAAAASFTDRPATFGELTAKAPREKGAPVSQSADTGETSLPAPTTVKPKESLERQVENLRGDGSPSELADALMALSEEQVVQGFGDKAAASATEAVSILQKDGSDAPRLGRALHDQGWAMLLTDQADKAAEPLTQARAIRKQVNAPAGEKAATLTLLVWAERAAGNNRGAVTVARDLVLFIRTDPSAGDLAGALNNLGVTQVVAGDPVGALVPLAESIKLREADGGLPLAESLHSQGWAYMTTKAKAKAIAPLTQAVEIRRELAPGSKDLGNSLLLLAWAEREGKAYSASIKHQTELVELSRDSATGLDLPTSLEGLGVTLVTSGDAAGAVVPFRELVAVREGKSSKELALALHELGWALVLDKQLPEAKTVLTRAVAMRKELGLYNDVKNSEILLGMATSA